MEIPIIEAVPRAGNIDFAILPKELSIPFSTSEFKLKMEP
jgi:hypothetical protein